jgi:hypothetical protein
LELKIRNPNIEIRNKFEFSKPKISKLSGLKHLKIPSFEIVSSFEFGASNLDPLAHKKLCCQFTHNFIISCYQGTESCFGNQCVSGEMRPAQELEERPPLDKREVYIIEIVDRLFHSHESLVTVKAWYCQEGISKYSPTD